MKQLLLKTMLLLCALVAGVNSAWADDYEKYTGALTEGDYVIVYLAQKTGDSNNAMKNTISSNRFQKEAVTISENIISSPATSLIWHIAPSGDYWTIYNEAVSKYAGGTTTNNQGALLSSITDYAKWTVSGTSTYDFENKGRASSSNRWLRNNAQYGFACYSSSTGGALTLFKKKSVSATDLAVKTAPTKVNYKVGETLDLTGLVLDATVGGNHVDVTTGYTASPANGATLNTVGAQTVTLTYGGQSTTQTIHVGDLSSIALTTTGVKTTYDEDQTFDPTNLVVTATYSDGESTPTTWTEDVTASCSFAPSGALTTSNNKVTVSYTWSGSGTTQTADITITVNAASAYTVTFNAGTGSCGTSSLTEASAKAGVILPTATIGVTGWSFAGWAIASVTNTEDEPTLYAAGDTYKPNDNRTLYAVYKYEDLTDNYAMATSMSDLANGAEVVISSLGNNKYTLANNNGTLTGISNFTATNNVISCTDSKAIWTLSKVNNNYTIANNGKYFAYSSSTITLSDDSYQWVIEKAVNGSGNKFLIRYTTDTQQCIEHNGTSWVLFDTTKDNPSDGQVNGYVGLTFYVRQGSVAYNSNPATLINPTIAWTTAGNKNLYVQDDATYNNAASVMGISKTPVYTSSDATVASVSEAGVVTALKAGSTTITAKVEKETGVNTETSVSYVVTVKDAKTIAGIKAIDNTSGKAFTADLTDAVVTYVKDNYAYIQDGSAAIQVFFANHGLNAGDKINGPVSGTVKISYSIDQLTALNLEDATVTDDGVIPGATTLTLAAIKNAGTTYDGKLVTVTGATVTGDIAANASSGASIKDGSQIESVDVSMNLYAPNQGVVIKATEQGSFTGFISLYNGSTYRLNIYDQGQISLTRNAPTAQTLTFESDAVELDEDTEAYDDFTGQTVSGAQGTVTYALTGDAIGTVNVNSGVVTLNGTCGTATITATAAANEVTEAGVTTPYTQTEKSYTITVRPRYTVTFSVNGVETELREANFGAGITVPSNPSAIGTYTFQGWSDATVSKTNVAPSFESLTAGSKYEPSGNETYYAVFAREDVVPNVAGSSTLTFSASPNSPFVNNEGTWTFTSLSNSMNGKSITFTPSGNVTSITSVSFTKSASAWGNSASISVIDDSENTIASFGKSDINNGNSSSEGTKNIDLSSNQSTYYIISGASGANAWMKSITFNYVANQVANVDYCTSPSETTTISALKLSTYASGDALDFTDVDGLEAYIAKADGSVIKLQQVTKVPANTGMLLRAKDITTATDFTVPVATGEMSDVTGNLFVRGAGVEVPTEDGSYHNYILTTKSGVIGFYQAANKVVPTNRAYLQTTTAEARISLNFDNEETTGINNVNVDLNDNNVYDMQGRKVNGQSSMVNGQLKKGLYIINGKKTVVK